jgi:Ribonuclease G/E
LLLAWGPGEIRAVVLEAEVAVELRVERDFSGSLVGDSFVGRVVNLVPALAAAFVDIGLPQHAFLPLRRQAAKPLTQGRAVVVTVIKDARGSKPPEVRLTTMQEAAAIAAPIPRRLGEPASPIARVLASLDGLAIGSVIVNDAATLAETRGILARTNSALASACRLEPGAGLFERHGVGDAFETALASVVPLGNGGSITIEATAAALLVDVDLGRAGVHLSMDRAILETNLLAAETLARQLRLRGIGGAVVVDFISMGHRDDRGKVADRLAAATGHDPVPVELHGWTRLGHFELTRRRRRAAIPEIMLGEARRMPTPMTVALDVLAQACFAPVEPGPFTVTVDPAVAALLSGPLTPCRQLAERRCGRKIVITAVAERASGSGRGG